jgi:hypothetical protein
MITYIKIGGKNRPVAYGYQVAYDYEINTGRNYNDLMVRVSEMMFIAAQIHQDVKPGDMEIEDAVALISDEKTRRAMGNFSVVPMTDATYYGMLYAHRREGVAVDFEASDVAGWLFSDRKAMSACMKLLVDSLPKQDEADDPAPSEAKKKTLAPGRTDLPTGGRSSKRPR